jgi:hypothetical protein
VGRRGYSDGNPGRAAEAMHWQLGEEDMARRAGIVPFTLSSVAIDAASQPRKRSLASKKRPPGLGGSESTFTTLAPAEYDCGLDGERIYYIDWDLRLKTSVNPGYPLSNAPVLNRRQPTWERGTVPGCRKIQVLTSTLGEACCSFVFTIE